MSSVTIRTVSRSLCRSYVPIVGPRSRISCQSRLLTTAARTVSVGIPPEIPITIPNTSPINATAAAKGAARDAGSSVTEGAAVVTAPAKKTRARSTTTKASKTTASVTKTVAAKAAKTTATKTAASKVDSLPQAQEDVAEPVVVKVRTRRTKAKSEGETESTPAVAKVTATTPIKVAKTTRTISATKSRIVPKATVATTTTTSTASQAEPATPTETSSVVAEMPVTIKPVSSLSVHAASQPIGQSAVTPVAPSSTPDEIHNPDTGFSFSSSSSSTSREEPESPAARQARGLAAAQHVASGGKLPPRYKSAARRMTALIVALPFVIVGTPLVWERVVEGKERKVYPRPGEAKVAEGGETLLE
ncbi:hypothetical protein ANO11243_023320 [Dothideomycetidae sp. 11243]|nr:hypothetical protein ANO11243_023320 [fungal sp. No.11243]